MSRHIYMFLVAVVARIRKRKIHYHGIEFWFLSEFKSYNPELICSSTEQGSGANSGTESRVLYFTYVRWCMNQRVLIGDKTLNHRMASQKYYFDNFSKILSIFANATILKKLKE